MPTKIRLQRHGKKGKPFYHVVIADSRAPRDGKYIEKIGIYNPNTNPATIEINSEKALSWLQVGAVPTNTVNTILKYRGIMYKNHLLKGVAKGAFTEAEAEKRFDKWLNEKESKIKAKTDSLSASASSEAKKRLDAETAVNEKRANDIAARKIKESEEAQAKIAEAQAPAEDVVTEILDAPEAPVEAEAPKAEEKAAEAPKAEEKAVEAPKAEEKAVEAPKAEEKTAEAPKAEEKAAEAPKAEEKAAEAPKAEKKAAEAPSKEKKE
ncbi:MAG: 30S ribosomal protein S16, partial [Bacteroidetes bacterium]